MGIKCNFCGGQITTDWVCGTCGADHKPKTASARCELDTTDVCNKEPITSKDIVSKGNISLN